MSGNKGFILATWNDNGPDASTQLEAYYTVQRGILVVASRAWSGACGPSIDDVTLSDSVDFLSSEAPGQNFDRRLPSNGSISGPIFSWVRSRSDNSTVTLGYGSKGMNYSPSLRAQVPSFYSLPIPHFLSLTNIA